MLPVPRKLRPKMLSEAHKRAPMQEAELAKRLGGRLTKGSGSGVDKGDVRHSVFRIECKCKAVTNNASFRVTTEMLDKIERAAAENNRWPAMHVEMVDKGSGRVLKSFAIMPTYVLEEMADQEARRRVADK